MFRTYRTPKGTELPLLNLRGRDYLEVKFRLVWFREDHPDWTIETELLSVNVDNAYSRAVIKDEKGRVIATSHKYEDKKGFPDFIEKSETGAIGRALALCGYGTQFCADELDEGARIVDSPVENVRQHRPAADGGVQTISHSRPVSPADDGIQALREENEALADADPSFSFGKYKGLRISQAIEKDGVPEVEKYFHWIEAQATKTGKPISTAARFAKVAFERMKNRTRERLSDDGPDYDSDFDSAVDYARSGK